MKKTKLISLVALLFIAGAVACKKTVPQSPSTPTGAVNARRIPDVMVADIGTGLNCVPGNGICNLESFRILRGMDECGVTGDITPDGQLLLIADCSALNSDSWNEFLNTAACSLNSDIVLPQDAVNAICDGQNPGVPAWGGPVGISAGNYPITITNGGADKQLEMKGTYDATTNTWRWSFSIH